MILKEIEVCFPTGDNAITAMLRFAMYSPRIYLALLKNSLIKNSQRVNGEPMEMNWSAIGTGVTIAGAVIGTIFAVGAFYGASTKSNAELEKRMDLLEELIEDRTEKIQDELTELRIDFARAGFPEDPSRRGHSKVTHGGG